MKEDLIPHGLQQRLHRSPAPLHRSTGTGFDGRSADQLNVAIRKTGTSSTRVYGSMHTRNQRLQHLTKDYASALIDLLKDEEYVNSLVATDGHEEEGEN